MPRRAHQQMIGLMLLELAPFKDSTPVKATAKHALVHGCKLAPLDLQSVDLEGILAELLRAIVAAQKRTFVENLSDAGYEPDYSSSEVVESLPLDTRMLSLVKDFVLVEGNCHGRDVQVQQWQKSCGKVAEEDLSTYDGLWYGYLDVLDPQDGCRQVDAQRGGVLCRSRVHDGLQEFAHVSNPLGRDLGLERAVGHENTAVLADVDVEGRRHSGVDLEAQLGWQTLQLAEGDGLGSHSGLGYVCCRGDDYG
jgi:hypothetical protein